MNRRAAVFPAILAAVAGAVQADDPDAGRVEFNRQIRPILADRCFRCHGPDGTQRKADLRLDTPAGALADGGGRRAVAPGNPDESELIARVASGEDSERMPPPEAGSPLAQQEVALLRRWIEQGAGLDVGVPTRDVIYSYASNSKIDTVPCSNGISDVTNNRRPLV
jgi:mono/diheme cytochrome c family protein